jgi:hypothetical protein
VSALIRAHTRVRPYNSVPSDCDLVSWANFKVQWKKIKKIGTLLGCNKRKIDKLIKERRGNPGKINRGRNSGARMQTRTAGSRLGSCDGKQPTQHLTHAQRSKKK